MTVNRFISGGIDTAVNFMGNTVEVIPIIAGEPKDPRRYMEIASNSYPFVMRWASSHLVDFAKFQLATRLRRNLEAGGPFIPAIFI